MTRLPYLSYVNFRSVTKLATQAFTIPVLYTPVKVLIVFVFQRGGGESLESADPVTLYFVLLCYHPLLNK